MKHVFKKLDNLSYKRIKSRIKHLRGQHDQLDHAWNRGMGQGGYGAGLAPNQMGPLPTENFYRQRLIDLTEQRRRGEITRAEMRQQMRELRGIVRDENNPIQPIQSSRQLSQDLVLANRSQYIKNFQKQRSKERLRDNINLDSIKSQMTPASGGQSGVKKITINGKNYYYRNTPFFQGRKDFNTKQKFIFETTNGVWSVVPGSLMGLVADNVASALGLPLAPVASISDEGYVISSELKKEPHNPNAIMNALNIAKSNYINDPAMYTRMIKFIEPLAIMDLIMAQGDGHIGNVDVIKNQDKSFYDSEYLLTSVDYDLSGRNDIKSTAVNQLYEALQLKESKDKHARLLTISMRETLTQFSQNIEWHPEISELARQQILDRVQAILEADKKTTKPTELFKVLEKNPHYSFGVFEFKPFSSVKSTNISENKEIIKNMTNAENAIYQLSQFREKQSGVLSNLSPQEVFLYESATGIPAKQFYATLKKLVSNLRNSVKKQQNSDSKKILNKLAYNFALNNQIEDINTTYKIRTSLPLAQQISQLLNDMKSGKTVNIDQLIALNEQQGGQFDYAEQIFDSLFSTINPSTKKMDDLIKSFFSKPDKFEAPRFDKKSGQKISKNNVLVDDAIRDQAKNIMANAVQFALSLAEKKGALPKLMRILSQFPNYANPKSNIYSTSSDFMNFYNQIKMFVRENQLSLRDDVKPYKNIFSFPRTAEELNAAITAQRLINAFQRPIGGGGDIL